MPGIPVDHDIPPITDKVYMTNFCQTEYMAKFADVEPTEAIAADNKTDSVFNFQKGATLEVTPNPISNNAKITYYLPYETEFVMDIYDVNGKKISSIGQGKKEQGYYEKHINFSYLNNSTYFVVLKTESEILSKIIIKN